MICHGVVLDDEGRKLSKRLRNYPDPEEVFEHPRRRRPALVPDGVAHPAGRRPAHRHRRLGHQRGRAPGPQPDLERLHVLHAVRQRRRLHGATARTDATGMLDRYILAKTRDAGGVDAPSAWTPTTSPAPAPRCSRLPRRAQQLVHPPLPRALLGARAPATDDVVRPDKPDAYDTLYTVLTTLIRVVAPLLPLLTEEIHLGLCGPARTARTRCTSQDWPDADDLPADPELVARHGPRPRGVLGRPRPAGGPPAAGPPAPRAASPSPATTWSGLGAAHRTWSRDEVNVKDGRAHRRPGCGRARSSCDPTPRCSGPGWAGAVQEVIRAAKAGDWTQQDDGTVDRRRPDAGRRRVRAGPRAPRGRWPPPRCGATTPSSSSTSR